MTTGVGDGVCHLVLVRTRLVDKVFGEGLLGICVEDTMVTLSGSTVGVCFCTLAEGAGKSGYTMTVGAGCGAFRAGAVGILQVTL